MRRLIRDDQPSEEWFTEVLTRSVLAGRWREAGRTYPAAQAALERAADRQSAVAGRLLTENFNAPDGIARVRGVFTSPWGLAGASDVKGNGR